MENIKKDKIKVPTSRRTKFFDEQYIGTEPTWDGVDDYTNDKFNDTLLKSLNYYNYFYTVKDLKQDYIAWVMAYSEEHETFDKDYLSKLTKISDNSVPLTACSLIKAHSMGMPLRPPHVEYLLSVVTRALGSPTDELDDEIVALPKPVVEKVTIQDRMNEIAKEHIAYFADMEDYVLVDGKTLNPKSFDYLTSKNVPRAMLGKIADAFSEHRNEILEAKAGTCEQLTEGYKKFKAADYKRIETFYSTLIEGLDQYSTVKQATKKASVRKPAAKEKLVAKLKYLKTDGVLKLVSINPVDIIGAKELFVFNIKTRKIGKYVADEQSGGILSISGSSIIGYDEAKSVAKTLRKPESQMKEFYACGKIQLRKYMDSIKATEIKLNGRINADTVLLKTV